MVKIIKNQSKSLKKEGNPVSRQLPPSLDSFLQSFAQSYEGINYTDIINLGRVWENIPIENKSIITSSIRKLKRELKDYSGDLYELSQEDDEVKKICDILIYYIKKV